MISTLQFKSITTIFIIIAVIQFPIYGIILGFSSRKGRLLISGIVLGIIHIFFVILCLILLNENFS